MSTVITPAPRTLSDTLLGGRADIHPAIADTILIALFAGVICAAAQISIPLAFTPVPITGQTFGVLFAGAVLGPRRGFLALLVYLAMGAAGLPVFAPGGAPGLMRLMGPTGGYLMSYPLAAAAVGALSAMGWDRRIPTAIAALTIGSLIIYAGGILWLGLYKGILFNVPVLWAGVYPFLIGDALKIVLAALLLPAGWGVVRRVHGSR